MSLVYMKPPTTCHSEERSDEESLFALIPGQERFLDVPRNDGPGVFLPPLALRLQHQLLHPPVQQLPHVELVLRWASNLVNPSKLLRLFPGLA